MKGSKTKISLTQLGIIANITRDIIIASIQNEYAKDSIWKQFPLGCCEFSSWIIGAYLEQYLGIKSCVLVGTSKKINNKINPTGDHCWLEVNNSFVDITADQFPTTGMAVVVEKKIKYFGSSWHHRYFKIQYPQRPIETYWLTQELELHTKAFFLFMRNVYSELQHQICMFQIVQENNKEICHFIGK